MVIDDISTTSYSITEFDPLVENWFKVKVTDVWGLTSTGNGMTNEIDMPPTQVNITDITYDLDSMTVWWDQSNAWDFASYELLYSGSEDGEYMSIVVIDDISTTSYSITEFDPFIENWFKIKVTDYWGLSTTMNWSAVNQIEGPPEECYIHDIIYENGSFQISWDENQNSDFVSYTLFESENEDLSNEIEVFTSTNRTETFATITVDENQYRYYQIEVQDIFDLVSESNVQMGSSWITFQHIFGSSGTGRTVRQTTDGGYVIAGYTDAFGAGGEDVWLIKTDSQGQEEWSQTFGGAGDDRAYSLEITQDGGYIISGSTNSFGSGGNDVWLIKTDSQGQEEWNQTFGDSLDDESYSVKPTSAGGYIVCAMKNSESTGEGLTWLINTDSQGNMVWEQDYSPLENGRSVIQDDDGGYVFINIEKIQESTYGPWFGAVVIKKVDNVGEPVWENSHYQGELVFGSAIDLEGNYISKTNDNGYVVIGWRSPNNTDIMLLKFDSQGQLEWESYYDSGGSSFFWDRGYSVEQTLDGGYIIAGYDGWFYNAWFIKTDGQGNLVWEYILDENYSNGLSAQQTNDGGYIFTGRYGGVLLTKTDSEGNFDE